LLGRLLSAALSVKVSVAVGEPVDGAVYEIVNTQAPRLGRVIGKDVAEVVQTNCGCLKAELPEPEIVGRELIVRSAAHHLHKFRLARQPSRTRSSSGYLEVERVDFLGTNVVRKQWSALWRQAEPGMPRCHHPPEILQAGDLLHLVVGNAHTINASARRRMSLAQKAHWANAVADKVATTLLPRARKATRAQAGKKKPKRTMSASARRKIAGAQRARWAKAKAGKKKAV
jgi:hypothetical protein